MICKLNPGSHILCAQSVIPLEKEIENLWIDFGNFSGFGIIIFEISLYSIKWARKLIAEVFYSILAKVFARFYLFFGRNPVENFRCSFV